MNGLSALKDDALGKALESFRVHWRGLRDSVPFESADWRFYDRELFQIECEIAKRKAAQ